MDNSTTSKPIQAHVSKRTGGWIIAATGLILALTAMLWSQSSTSSKPEENQEQVIISQSAFEEATGVHIVRVALTAADGMIDLRYLVIDPNKALILRDEENPLMIVDEATGTTLATPWMNHTHNGDYQAGVTYYTLLMNSGGVLIRGSKVTVVVGDVRLEHLEVQ